MASYKDKMQNVATSHHSIEQGGSEIEIKVNTCITSPKAIQMIQMELHKACATVMANYENLLKDG